MLEQWVAELNKEYQLVSIPPSKNKELFFLSIGEQKIHLKPLDLGLRIFAPILPLESQNLEELLTLLMKANFLGQGTGGGVLALTENESFLTLEYILPYEMSYKAFKEKIEEFLNFLEFWQNFLGRAGNFFIGGREIWKEFFNRKCVLLIPTTLRNLPGLLNFRRLTHRD
mgnify:CR=1 FL=1